MTTKLTQIVRTAVMAGSLAFFVGCDGNKSTEKRFGHEKQEITIQNRTKQQIPTSSDFKGFFEKYFANKVESYKEMYRAAGYKAEFSYAIKNVTEDTAAVGIYSIITVEEFHPLFEEAKWHKEEAELEWIFKRNSDGWEKVDRISDEVSYKRYDKNGTLVASWP